MKKKLIITLIIVIVLLSIILIYSKNVTTHHIKVIENKIIDQNLPLNYHGLKIVQLTDIHYGKATSLDDLKKIVKKINEIKPDVFIFTGDLFSKSIKVSDKELKELKNIFNSINAKYAKYVISGENDIIYKDNFYQVFSNDYMVLDNESTLLYIDSVTPIRFTGLNDYTKETILTEEESKIYNILLLHKPDEIEKLKNKYNLAFAGHSMGGQIKLPFYGPLIKLDGAKKYISGFYTVNDTTLYVSDGIGSESINMRINNSPKINFYRIYNN